MTTADFNIDQAGPIKKSKWNFLEEIKAELRKVNWTSKAELIIYTKLVLGSTLFLGMGIYLVDLTIKSLLTLIKIFAHKLGA